MDIRDVARSLQLRNGRGDRQNFSCFSSVHKNGDQNPSLSVSNGLYYCHGCGVKGDAIQLVREVRGLSFQEAKAYLESLGYESGWYDRSDLPSPKRLPEVSRMWPTNNAVELSTRRALASIWKRCDPFHERVNELEEAKGMVLPFRVVTPEAYQFWENHKSAYLAHDVTHLTVGDYVMAYEYPWLAKTDPDEPTIVSLRLRKYGHAIPKHITRFYTFGAVQAYIPEPIPDNPDRIMLCEGETDTLAAMQSGIPAIGLPGVQSAVEKMASYLTLMYPETTIIMGFDNDDAGNKGCLRLLSLRNELPPSMKLIRYRHPEGAKDLSDVYKEHGTVFVDNAVPTLSQRVQEVFQVSTELPW